MAFLASSASSAGMCALSGADCIRSSGLCGNNVPEEYDSVERPAMIYLFTRDLENTIINSNGEVPWQHWDMVFYFKRDKSWRTTAGYCGEDNEIVPSYSKEPPREEGTFYEVEEIKISPEQIRQYVLANEYNGKPYWAASQNCQDWVRGLAKFLGEQIETKVRQFHTLKETNPLLAALGTSSSASSNATSRFFKSLGSSCDS